MSTAGKVLSVVVTLALILWIVLAAMETQLHANFGAKLNAEMKTTEQTEAAVAKQEEEAAKAKSAALLQMKLTGSAITVLNNNLIDMQRAVSVSRETLSRANYQLERVDSTAAGMAKSKEYRGQELEQSKEDLTKKLQELDQLKKLNADLKGSLATLRDQFKSMLASNQELKRKIEENRAKSQAKPTATAMAR